MDSGTPRFSVGIEEEYLLVERDSRDLCSRPKEAMIAQMQQRVRPEQVSPELLRCQVEVGTRPMTSFRDLRKDLANLRRLVIDTTADYGLAPIAASTHPFADWSPLPHTDKERYSRLTHDHGQVARRMLICGQHVHVGIEDDGLRIDLMNQARYFLPHLLCLSTSSPFWRGKATGLKSYRLAVFDEMPRTGLPETFHGWGDYQRHVQVLIDAGVIEDGSKLWWDIRPSWRYPTLEMRICDTATRLDDAITLAALYTCLLRFLWRMKRRNMTWRRYAVMLIAENRWRAQRYGIEGPLIDFGRSALVPCAQLLDEFLDMIADDAVALDCVREVEAARGILHRGTSADRQLQVHADALERGLNAEAAMHAVVDWLIEETAAGV